MSLSQAAQQRTWFIQYRTLNIAKNLGRYLSCTECIAQRNDFKLILTVKMKTRHPVEGSFGSEFAAICNHCKDMAAWSHKTLKFCRKFLRFFVKMTNYSKILNFCPENFHHNTDRQSTLLYSNFVKRGPRESVHYLVDKNFCLPLKLSLLRGSHPKSAMASPQQCTQSAPYVIQIGSLQQSYSRMCENRQIIP